MYEVQVAVPMDAAGGGGACDDAATALFRVSPAECAASADVAELIAAIEESVCKQDLYSRTCRFR